MSDPKEIPAKDAEDNLGVEIIDLEVAGPPGTPNIVRSDTFFRAARNFWQWQRVHIRKPVQLAIVSVIVLVGLVILLNLSGVLSFLSLNRARTSGLSRPPATMGAPPFGSASSVPQLDGLTCLVNAAWSPDSKRFALLGYGQDCPQGAVYKPGLINVYDAHSAKLIVQVRLDPTVLSALRKQFSQMRENPVIFYDSVLWSPDGQQLALPFTASFGLDQSTPSFVGILLIKGNGEQTVFLAKMSANDLEDAYLLWDLVRGVPTAIKNSSSSSASLSSFMNISPASSYSWDGNGTVIAEAHSESVGVSTSRLAPIGNPDGGNSFTLWQPGTAERTTQVGKSSFHSPGVYTWNTFFTAWSPDGRYIVDSLYIGGRFEMIGQPSPNHRILRDFGMEQLPVLNVRDSALQQVLDALPTSETGLSSVLVSWRPDGRVLATSDGGTINLYDCAAGHQLASWLPQDGNPVSLSGTTLLRWSPDGSRLLLSSPTLGYSVIWQTR